MLEILGCMPFLATLMFRGVGVRVFTNQNNGRTATVHLLCQMRHRSITPIQQDSNNKMMIILTVVVERQTQPHQFIFILLLLHSYPPWVWHTKTKTNISGRGWNGNTKYSQCWCQGRIQPLSLGGGGDFSNILQSSLITGSLLEESTSQHCCVKTTDGKMSLHRECFFPNCTNHGEKSHFFRF